MEELGFRVTHIYGMTELQGPSTLCVPQDDWEKLPLEERAALNARQGVRYAVVEGQMVADPRSMKPVPRDGKTIGEIMMRGNTVMLGYLKEPKATAEAFRGGWMHTGDLAVEHPDGYIEIKDRAKDIIISGGENISSVEVEIALYKHPSVQLAAVVAQPDHKWGETPCAFVQLKPGRQRDRRGDHRVLPGSPGAFQGAEDRGVRPIADDGDRQDPEICPARERALDLIAVHDVRDYPVRCADRSLDRAERDTGVCLVARCGRATMRVCPFSGESRASRCNVASWHSATLRSAALSVRS